jgi:dolichyl-diphosphooligosaccharide--protein glycosyltransferase
VKAKTQHSSERESAARGAESRAEGSPRSRFELWLGLLIVVVCAACASYLRLSQLAVWNSDPDQYMASGVPMMTTLDAYYSLRIARLWAAGTFVPHGPVPARHYARPEQSDPNDWYDQSEPKELPLLSAALVVLSHAFDGNIDKAGLVLSPLLSSLFMIPLFLCCWRLGAPAAGLMGGLVATFCIEYYQRTGVGWVETDPLNLFFPWTVSFLFLGMHSGRSRERLLLSSAAAGAVLYVFFRWYPKPGLTLLFVCALAVHLRLAGVSWRRLLLCVATVLVFANPVQLVAALGSLEDFARRYLGSTAAPDVASAIRFPEVWSTISEMRRLRWSDSLQRILPSAGMAVVGLLGFLFFALRHWRRMVALAPVVALGMLAFLSSRRFIFYLAPLVGIGWGYLVCLITKGLLSRLGLARDETAGTTHSKSRDFVRIARSAFVLPEFQTAASYFAVVGVFIVWFAPVAARALVPRPAVPAPVFRDFQVLAERLPINSRMWTWWDLGFAIVDTTGFGVYHDGAAQYTPQTNLIAASFVSPSQPVLHNVIRFVDREGNRGIRRLAGLATSADDLVLRMHLTARRASGVPIFVLFTPDMLLKYSSMQMLGTLSARATSRPSSFGIRWLQCERFVEDVLDCAGETVDLRKGLIARRSAPPGRAGEEARLRRAVIVEDGRVLRQRDYADGAEMTAEILMKAGAVQAVYLLDAAAFESNLNQMYFLGRFDAALFEEVFNDFPYARVFRVRAAPD